MENEFPRRGGAHTFEQLEAEALEKKAKATASDNSENKTEEESSVVEDGE